MVPLLLATLWNDILSHRSNLNLPADLSSAAVEIGRKVMIYASRIGIPEFELIAGNTCGSRLQNGCFFIPPDLRTNLCANHATSISRKRCACFSIIRAAAAQRDV
jgi:hypothetical protein